MGLPPGTIRRLPLKKGTEMLGSTHGLPLSFLLSLVRVSEVVLIGIQPKEYGIGEGLSPEARAAADCLIRLLRENREHEIPELNFGKNGEKEEVGDSPSARTQRLRNSEMGKAQETQ